MREDVQIVGDDPGRYQVQWGYAAADATPSHDDITNWTGLPWSTIYNRVNSGPLLPAAAKFQAPSDRVVLAIRVWKKWATPYRELDVNLDDIRLAACAPVQVAPRPPANQCITYTVRKGDTLAAIAARYRDTVSALAKRNKIVNVNKIYVGQKLTVCDP
jgi:LysM repeat protein